MVFILVRIMPVLAAAIYFLSLFFVYRAVYLWPWIFMAALLADFFYFFLLKSRTGQRRIFWLFIHSLIVVSVGFSYALILSNALFSLVFALLMAGVYWLYLESSFHYFYQSRKAGLMDLNHILSYSNLILYFLLSAVLYDFFIFIGLPLVWLFLIFCCFSFLVFFVRWVFMETPLAAFFAAVFAFLAAQLFWALSFLPVSFFVMSALLAIFYYLSDVLVAAKLANAMNRKKVMMFCGLACLAALCSLLTFAWI